MNEEEIFNLKVGRDFLRESGMEECAAAVEKAMESMNKPIPMNPGHALRVQFLAPGGLYEAWVQIRTVDINTNYEENIRQFAYRPFRPPTISLRVDMEVIYPGAEAQGMEGIEMMRHALRHHDLPDLKFFRERYEDAT